MNWFQRTVLKKKPDSAGNPPQSTRITDGGKFAQLVRFEGRYICGFNDAEDRRSLVSDLRAASHLSPATNGGTKVMVNCGRSGLFVLFTFFCKLSLHSSS